MISEPYLGQLVKISLHKNDDTFYIVKRIDTEEEQAYIVPCGSAPGAGFWVGFSGLFVYFRGLSC